MHTSIIYKVGKHVICTIKIFLLSFHTSDDNTDEEKTVPSKQTKTDGGDDLIEVVCSHIIIIVSTIHKHIYILLYKLAHIT